MHNTEINKKSKRLRGLVLCLDVCDLDRENLT